MKAYWMQMSEGAASLEVRETPQPQPGPGQLLVRMHAAGLNRGEFILGHGLHAAGNARVIGLEGAGEVVALGAGVTGFKPGDRVMGRCPAAFAEYALMSAREAIQVPARLSWPEAAVVTLTYQVAYDLLVLQGKMARGEWVLVNGISSGVGVAVLQMAKLLGGRVIGTSGSAEKLARLKDLGLDVAICTRASDYRDAVLAATAGAGVDLVVDNVGGSVFAESVRCMRFEARLGMVGYVDGVLKAELDLEALHAKRLKLFGVSNKMRTPEHRAADVPAFTAHMLPAFADGRIQPVVDRVFPFGQLPEAKAHMEANRHLGKIVLAIGAD
jgi:NADPH:quinone reductase-like Zn-dependent oxidoreductase